MSWTLIIFYNVLLEYPLVHYHNWQTRPREIEKDVRGRNQKDDGTCPEAIEMKVFVQKSEIKTKQKLFNLWRL